VEQDDLAGEGGFALLAMDRLDLLADGFGHPFHLLGVDRDTRQGFEVAAGLLERFLASETTH